MISNVGSAHNLIAGDAGDACSAYNFHSTLHTVLVLL